MSDHVTEWLNAYLDGELRGSRLHNVEAHLDECEVCRVELEALEGLSDLLQEAPAPEFTPPERFAAQVRLRLPHPQPKISRKRILEVGWWMIPVGLLATWILINAVFLANDILSVANSFGLSTSVSNWLVFGSSNQANWSATLGQFGILSGDTLDLAVSTEMFTRTSLPQIILQISIALLYLSWFAIWWARYLAYQRPGHGEFLES